MKMMLLSLALILCAVGCSKKKAAAIPFAVGHGDILPATLVTNDNHGDVSYGLRVKLTSAKEEELAKLAQEHPDGTIEVVFASKLAKMDLPANTLKMPIEWDLFFRSHDAAITAEEGVKELTQ